MLAILDVLAQAGLGETLQNNPALAVATLFGAGVLTSLTPCVYPMIPITAGIIAGTTTDAGTDAGGDTGVDARADAGTVTGADPGTNPGMAARADSYTGGGAVAAVRRAWPGRRTVVLTLAYVTGLALFYALLGVVAGLTGSLFGTVASNPWVRFAVGNLLLLFGLAMLDVIPVPVPRRLMRWAAGRSGGSVPAVFVMGAASGVVAAPCGAPAFAAVLTFVAMTGSGVLGFIYLFVFSLGMTALLVLVGLFSGTLAALPQAGRWMVWVKRAAGVLLIGVAEYYFIQAGMVL